MPLCFKYTQLFTSQIISKACTSVFQLNITRRYWHCTCCWHLRRIQPAYRKNKWYRVWWWPGDVRGRGIWGHGIDPILTNMSSPTEEGETNRRVAHLLAVISTWIRNNYMPNIVSDEITYPSPNFNGVTVEVWEWIRNLISYFTMDVIINPC